MLYRSFTSSDEISQAYNPMLGKDPKQVIGEYVRLSQDTLDVVDVARTEQFGPTLAEHVDVFSAQQQGAPLHIFLHGGYWRACSSKDFAFVARQLVPAGITTLVVNYALCPQVSMSEIVRQARASVAWAWHNAERLGADRNNITVSGHSAGGHLVGMVLSTDWEADYGLPADVLKGAVAISGLFDLGPFPHSWLQPDLQLTEREVELLSPLKLAPVAKTPVRLRVGALESEEFHRQSRTYQNYLETRGFEVQFQAVSDTDHYSVMDEMYREGGMLVEDVLQLSAV
ncbi:esterase [Marinobacterium zhoushanense]|uniref:Esterase n=1 Tax=Marinobacterium zhoushanense TaxID=1679163 RepID=A0ABQ1K473_9GAMM|nr:alpha/beta hydrolase [Marinobacterium zhoushanense]GGB87035.1 esterase [Marinobacterium zhoushanense]